MHLLDKRSTQTLPVALMIHDNSTDRTAIVPATHHSNFCPINFQGRQQARKLPNPDTGRCSGPHARYTDVFNESIALADRPGKHESSARVDYVPALCTHRPSLLPIEWSGEVFGSRRRGRFTARNIVNLRKDHCRNLPSKTTRERVIKHQREGVWSLHCAPSPPCPGDTGTRVPMAKRTTPGVNYAKESE
ncbi:hypothetical protein V6N13_116647 [Hibiscus sabdariffa]